MIKRAVSPIISVILLILVAVILITMFLLWAKVEIKEDLQSSSDALSPASDIDCLNYSLSVDSCFIYSSSKKVEILLTNATPIRYFDIMLTIEAENLSQEKEKWVGVFSNSLFPGHSKLYNTDTNFLFTKNEDFSNLNFNEISNIILTNGACKREIINLINMCEIVNE